MAQQSGHDMGRAVGIFETFAEYHIAAALAMHGTRCGETRKAITKTMSRCKFPCMQFRIAARQPADIASVGRRLIR